VSSLSILAVGAAASVLMVAAAVAIAIVSERRRVRTLRSRWVTITLDSDPVLRRRSTCNR
jgi:hypothetical protein